MDASIPRPIKVNEPNAVPPSNLKQPIQDKTTENGNKAGTESAKPMESVSIFFFISFLLVFYYIFINFFFIISLKRYRFNNNISLKKICKIKT